MALVDSITEALDKAQSSVVHHPKLIKSLKTLHDQSVLVEFFEAFVQPLMAALVIFKKEPVVERVLEFVAKFSASVTPLDPAPGGDEELIEDSEGDENRDSGEEGEDGAEGHPHEEEEEEEEEEELTHNFFNLLLAKLLSFHEASSKAVRFRSCQLVAKMISYAVERQCQLDSAMLAYMVEIMLQRINDKIPVVRVHAVHALELLQDSDGSLPAALMQLLEGDSSADVRSAVLSTIMITIHTLPGIISRTRDVKEQIRRDAFLLLAEKCNIRNFTIKERIQLLNDGLNDRSEMVRDACVNGLLHSWNQSLDGDFLTLLSKLAVESSPEVAELALSRLFAGLPVDSLVGSMLGLMDPVNRMETWEEEEEEEHKLTPAVEKVVLFDLLNCEEVFYWSCLCRYLHGMGVEGDEHMEKIVPTVSEFCEYVQSYVQKVLLPVEEIEERMQKQFVCQQLLSIFSVMDLSDEVGKRQLAKLVLEVLVLPELPVGLISPLLAQQTVLWPQQSYRVEKLVEVIADLRQPLAPGPAPSADGGESSQQQTAHSCTLLSEDSQMMANLSLLDIRSDPDTLSRCLTVATEMLKELQLRRLPATLKTMVDVLLLPSIQNEVPYIRDMALNCLGLACLLDVSLARNHLLLFLQVSQVDHEAVQATAVKVVFDLLHVFGFESFNLSTPSAAAAGSSAKRPNNKKKEEEEEEDSQADTTLVEEKEQSEEVLAAQGQSLSEVKDGESGEDTEEEESEKDSNETTQRILTIMANFIDGESFILRGIAAEGIAKLLLSGRILSQKLLARLLVLWFNPTTQDEDRLRAVLGLFFPAFAASDKSCRVVLGEVFIPVLETVSEAPPTSPLRDVDLTQIADFLVHLSSPQQPNEDSVHDSLAMTVANGVLSEPDNSLLTRVYCRSLTRMQLTASNKSNAADLLVLLGHLTEHVRDRTSLQYLRKFRVTLKKMSPSSPPHPDGSGGEGGGEQKGEGGEGGNDDTLVVSSPPQSEVPSKTKGTAKKSRPKNKHPSSVEGRQETAVEGVVGESGEKEDDVPDETLLLTSPLPASTAAAAAVVVAGEGVGGLEDVPDETLLVTPRAKATAAAKKKAATTKKKRKKKRLTFKDSISDSSASDAEIVQPQQLSALPSRVRTARAAKTSAYKLISDSILATPKGGRVDEEESDDSLVGDHSPFIRQTAKSYRTGDRTVPMLDYDDDED